MAAPGEGAGRVRSRLRLSRDPTGEPTGIGCGALQPIPMWQDRSTDAHQAQSKGHQFTVRGPMADRDRLQSLARAAAGQPIQWFGISPDVSELGHCVTQARCLPCWLTDGEPPHDQRSHGASALVCSGVGRPPVRIRRARRTRSSSSRSTVIASSACAIGWSSSSPNALRNRHGLASPTTRSSGYASPLPTWQSATG